MEQSNRTSGALWYGVLACWAVATGILAWRFLPNLTPDFLGVAQVFLLACLSYFLLTGVFNVVVNVWSRFLHTPNPTRRVEGTPRVALLYCTYNDFEREAAETMRRQTHPVDVWILDDSTDPRAEEHLLAEYAEKNLDTIVAAYPYFVAKGIPGSEKLLLAALAHSADEYAIYRLDMASALLNCGNAELEQGVREWCEQQSGCEIKTGEAAIWGASRWGASSASSGGHP